MADETTSPNMTTDDPTVIEELLESQTDGRFRSHQQRDKYLKDLTEGVYDVYGRRPYEPNSRLGSNNVEVLPAEDDHTVNPITGRRIRNMAEVIKDGIMHIMREGQRRPEYNIEGDVTELAADTAKALNQGVWASMAGRMLRPRMEMTPEHEEEDRVLREAELRGVQASPQRLVPENMEEALDQRAFEATWLRPVLESAPPQQHTVIRDGALGILDAFLGPYHAFTRAWEMESAGQRAHPADMLAIAAPAAVLGPRLPVTSTTPAIRTMDGVVMSEGEVMSSGRLISGEAGRVDSAGRFIPDRTPEPILPPGQSFGRDPILDHAMNIRTPQSIVNDHMPFYSNLHKPEANMNIPSLRNMTDEQFDAFMGSAPDRTPYDLALRDQQARNVLQRNRDELAEYIRGGFQPIEGGLSRIEAIRTELRRGNLSETTRRELTEELSRLSAPLRTTTQEQVGELFTRYNIEDTAIRVRTSQDGSRYFTISGLPDNRSLRVRLSEHPQSRRGGRSRGSGEIDASTPDGLEALEARLKDIFKKE